MNRDRETPLRYCEALMREYSPVATSHIVAVSLKERLDREGGESRLMLAAPNYVYGDDKPVAPPGCEYVRTHGPTAGRSGWVLVSK